MATLIDTAYPRLRRTYSRGELQNQFHISSDELQWIGKRRGSDSIKLETAVMLKCFQTLGHFPKRRAIPETLISYISLVLFGDQSDGIVVPQRQSHRIKTRIRQFLNVKQFVAKNDEEWLYRFACEMAETKESPVDIINAMIEILVKE